MGPISGLASIFGSKNKTKTQDTTETRTQAKPEPNIIALWSPVSSGKTTLAKGLVEGYAKQGKKTCYLDLDLLTSDFKESDSGGVSLDIIANLILDDDYNATTVVSSLKPVAKVSKNYFQVKGLNNLLNVDIFTKNYVEELIQTLAGHMEKVVIDLSGQINLEATVTSLYLADSIYIPTYVEKRHLEQVMKYLPFLEQELMINPKKLFVVLNGWQKDQFELAEVEQVINKEITGLIPQNPDFTKQEIVGIFENQLSNNPLL